MQIKSKKQSIRSYISEIISVIKAWIVVGHGLPSRLVALRRNSSGGRVSQSSVRAGIGLMLEDVGDARSAVRIHARLVVVGHEQMLVAHPHVVVRVAHVNIIAMVTIMIVIAGVRAHFRAAVHHRRATELTIRRYRLLLHVLIRRALATRSHIESI